MANEQIKFVDGLKSYFKGVRAEWGKITWPLKQQVFVETVWVIVITVAFTLYILLLDLIYKGIFSVFKLN